MKIAELVRKKIDLMFGDINPNEKEFLENYVYRGIDPSDGLTTKQIKLLVPELYNQNIRIIGIETIDDKGDLDTYVWEQFEREYVPSWIVKAIMAIEEKEGSPKCFMYLDMDNLNR